MTYDNFGGRRVESDQRHVQVGNVTQEYNSYSPWTGDDGTQRTNNLLGGVGVRRDPKTLGNRVWFENRWWNRLGGRWHIFGDEFGNCWNSEDGRIFKETVVQYKGKGKNNGDKGKGPVKGGDKGPKGLDKGPKGQNKGKGSKPGGKSPAPNPCFGKGKPPGKDGKPDDGKGKGKPSVPDGKGKSPAKTPSKSPAKSPSKPSTPDEGKF